jgi:UDP-N-acetylglucosamine 2-epimerase (non-hydrolysing)
MGNIRNCYRALRDRIDFIQVNNSLTKHKILAVFGTRPDAIKMAPVVLELKRRPDIFDLKVIVTGQHREMLDQVLSVFRIQPDYDLNIMQPGQTLAEITTRSLSGLDPIFAEQKPAAVLAQGDTTTTFVAALAAFYHRAAFGHIEAGLRTGNLFDPFPEEANRLLTTRLASLHFAPTQESADNLLREGIAKESVVLTGNTVIDALLTTASSDLEILDPSLASILSTDGPVVLVTAHRRENWGEPMRRICESVRRLVAALPAITVVFPMHRNPIVRSTVVEVLGGLERVHLIEPPDYAPFVKLEQKSTIILTDSGGVQEEAPSLGKPVLVLRETTERPEGVTAGTAILVGTDPDRIFDNAYRLLTDQEAYCEIAQAMSPYGDGGASSRICDALAVFLSP